MKRGTFACRFAMALRGVIFSDELTIESLDGHMVASFTREGKGLTVRVRVECDSEQEGTDRAMHLVREAYEQLLLRFGADIVFSTAPEFLDGEFTSGDDRLRARAAVRMGGRGTLTATLSHQVSATEAKELAQRVQLRLAAPSPAFVADLHTAVGMFCVALEAQDLVVRFLALYSAVVLAATFKGIKGEEQDRADALLQKGDPTLQRLPTGKLRSGGRRKGTRKEETLYTKLRNDLMHAAERRTTLDGALTAIRGATPAFQGLVASILSAM